MNRTKGFTLIELLIVIAIIAVLVVALAGFFGPRKAGAQTMPVGSVESYLTANNIPFLYSQTSGNVVILNNAGASRWANAAAACAELKAQDARVKRVVLSDGDEADAKTTLQWSAEGALTNLDPQEVANCL